MSFADHRKRLYETLPDGSLVLSFAGEAPHTNEDDYHRFEVNSQFFYLTGLEREKMALLAVKAGGKTTETLFIEQADPTHERWTGKMPTKEEAAAVSGVEDVRYLEDLSSLISRAMGRSRVEYAYMDVYRCQESDLPDVNALRAQDFMRKYPAVTLRDLFYNLARTTTGSHVTLYNDINYGSVYSLNAGDYFPE